MSNNSNNNNNNNNNITVLAKSRADIAKYIKTKFRELGLLSREPNTFYISELPYCITKIFFNIKFNARVINTSMRYGVLWHYILPLLLKDNPEYKDAQFEVSVEYRYEDITIKGRGDVIVVTHDSVDEWKFSSQEKSSKVNTNNNNTSNSNNDIIYIEDATNEVTKHTLISAYLMQANEYAYLLGKKKARVIYVYDDFNVDVYELNVMQELHDKLVSKALLINSYLKQNKIPDIGSEYSFECRNCPYNIICPNKKS